MIGFLPDAVSQSAVLGRVDAINAKRQRFQIELDAVSEYVYNVNNELHARSSLSISLLAKGLRNVWKDVDTRQRRVEAAQDD